MKKRNMYNSIKRMLFFYASVILVIVYIIVSGFAIRQRVKEYETLARERVFDLVESINRDLYLTINKSSHIVNDEEIIKGLQKNYTDDIQAVMNFYQILDAHCYAQKDQSLLLHSDVIIYPVNESLPDGECVTGIEKCKNPVVVQNMRDADIMFVWNEYTVTPEPHQLESAVTTYISLYRNIFYFNRYLGCLEMRIPSSDFQKYIAKTALDAHEKIYVVNASDCEKLAADSSLVCYSDSLLNNYYAVLTRSKAAFAKEIAGILCVYFFIFAAILFFIKGVSSLSVNSITGEIYDFLDSIRDDAAENTPNNAEEINLIKSKFLELIEKERVASENLMRANHEKQALEVEMLQNRINPHLLYNSLSAIKWRLIRKKDFEFATLMDSLSDYYRMVLNKGSNITTIGNELNMIRDYVKINRFLQENEFEFIIDADESLLDVPIFKLLLQPVVENSIKHGIANRKDGKIVLKIEKIADDTIRFTVQDNGYGMTEETLKKVWDNKALSPNNAGYGLYNTARRLQNFYGERYGITIRSEEGKGTLVTLTAGILTQRELEEKISVF